MSRTISRLFLNCKMTRFPLVFQILLTMVFTCGFALNVTETKTTMHQLPRYPAGLQLNKGLPGFEHILGVMGPLALAAMVSLPFVAPAAAALLPLASLSSVFGRRRRHLDGPRFSPLPDSEMLMRRIQAAATRRHGY